MRSRILSGAIGIALGLALGVTAAVSQTGVPFKQRPGADCNMSSFCGVPFVYVPDPGPPRNPPLMGEDRLRGSGAKFVNGVAIETGGQIGWGPVCFGSPICAWQFNRQAVQHVVYKPDLGFTYAYPLKFPEGTFGGVGSIAMNSKGHIFAFVRNDPGKPMIFEFDEDYKIVRSFGTDMFSKPHGMEVDADDNLWVCDQFGDTVTKFSPEGKVLLTLGVKGQRGDWNEEKGQRLLWQPLTISFAANGDIYIGMGHANESPNDGAARVLHLDKDGKFINQWFGNNAGPGHFSMVHGMTINPNNGNIYIADREEYRIVVYTGDGKFVKTIQSKNLICEFLVDKDKQLWMATGMDGQIVKADWDGNVLGAAGEGPGKGFGQLGEASYMVKDIHGNIFVGDTTRTMVMELVAPRK